MLEKILKKEKGKRFLNKYSKSSNVFFSGKNQPLSLTNSYFSNEKEKQRVSGSKFKKFNLTSLYALEALAKIPIIASELSLRAIELIYRAPSNLVYKHFDNFTGGQITEKIENAENNIREKSPKLSYFGHKAKHAATIGLYLGMSFLIWKGLDRIIDVDPNAPKRNNLETIDNFVPKNNLLMLAGDLKEHKIALNAFKVRYSDAKEDTISKNYSTMTKEINGEEYIFHFGTKDAKISKQKKGYNYIGLRGHTNQMRSIERKARRYRSRRAVYIVGGCEGTRFLDEFANRRTAVIARSTKNDRDMNSYIAYQGVNLIPKTDSWKHFSDSLCSLSAIADSQFVMPGKGTYGTR